MQRNFFIKRKYKPSHANIGGHDNDIALFSLKEGYKNGADNLVSFVLAEGAKDTQKTLNAYANIYPIISLYRHSIEISLKQIYFRLYGELPNMSDDLIILWDLVEEKVINTLNSPSFIQMIKKCKKTFVLNSFDSINFEEIYRILYQIQYFDHKAETWRYSMDKCSEIYSVENESIDYINLKKNIDDIYDALEYIYFIVLEYVTNQNVLAN